MVQNTSKKKSNKTYWTNFQVVFIMFSSATFTSREGELNCRLVCPPGVKNVILANLFLCLCFYFSWQTSFSCFTELIVVLLLKSNLQFGSFSSPLLLHWIWSNDNFLLRFSKSKSALIWYSVSSSDNGHHNSPSDYMIHALVNIYSWSGLKMWNVRFWNVHQSPTCSTVSRSEPTSFLPVVKVARGFHKISIFHDLCKTWQTKSSIC